MLIFKFSYLLGNYYMRFIHVNSIRELRVNESIINYFLILLGILFFPVKYTGKFN